MNADRGETTVDILLVDDRPGGLLDLEAALAEPGRNPLRAGGGEEVLALLRAGEFAAVLGELTRRGFGEFPAT